MAGQSPRDIMRAEDQRSGKDRGSPVRSRRRLTPVAFVAPIAIVAVLLAAGWCALWFLSASIAKRSIAGWVKREAAAGRIYSCKSQEISGFPFRIQARCIKPAVALGFYQPPFTAAAKEASFVAEVYRPTLLVGAVIGPLTLAGAGSPSFLATWLQARMTVSGLPDPDAVSIIIDRPRLDQDSGAHTTTLFLAKNIDLNGRIIGGTANDHPVIDAVLQFASATAPTLHPLLAEPLKGNIEVVLRGFRDLSPKAPAEHFREMQAGNGSIEVKSLRLEHADAVAVGTGTLTLNEHGRLEGLLRIAVFGLESIVPRLGFDRLIDQGLSRLTGSSGQRGKGLSALDSLMPGLSGIVRQSANANLIEDIEKMGKATEIDHKPAVELPLRFSDGAVYLGMIRLGEVPPLF